MEYCDLHTHSYYSDGSDSPAQLIDLAVSAGVKAIALTDHNTIDGLDEFCSCAKDKPVIPICGVELTTEYSGFEVHVLGLDLPKSSFLKVHEFCAEFLERKRQSNIDLVNKLNQKGFDISYDKIKKYNKNERINRSHIASELVKMGYVSDISQAFDQLLSEKAGLYKPCKRHDVFQTIAFLKEIGAVPVLAHPFLNFTQMQLKTFLPVAIKNGLMGMETVYSKFDDGTINLAKQIANEHGILQSGGSDYHGVYKPGFSVGVGKGNLKVDFLLAQKIMQTTR